MKKSIISVVFSLLVLFSLSDTSASASYIYNRFGEALPSQSGYTAEFTVSGETLGTVSFKNPRDLFSEGNDFYIADTGNNRIVVTDSALEKTTAVLENFTMPDNSHSTLDSPSGVFATDDFIYIADTGNERIIVTDRECKIIREIRKPESEIYDSGKIFMPEKIAVDKSGNIYAVLGNITTGCAVFSPDGEFMGFFGAERVKPTAEVIINYMRNLFMSESKKARRKRSIPSGVDNIDISGDFIFTCTSSENSTDIIKKLNPSGKNVFDGRDIHFGDYKPKKSNPRYTVPDTEICDVDVSPDGFITCLDSATGHIFRYNRDGGLLFIVGEISDRTGGFTSPVAVECIGGNIYILDSRKNNITVFTLTSFGKTVHEAVGMYNSGFYAESLELWNEIIMRDGNYTYAYRGKAFALLRNGDYKSAMKYAEIAGDSEIYNKAFKEYRREFLSENTNAVVFSVLSVTAVYLIIAKRRKRKK